MNVMHREESLFPSPNDIEQDHNLYYLINITSSSTYTYKPNDLYISKEPMWICRIMNSIKNISHQYHEYHKGIYTMKREKWTRELGRQLRNQTILFLVCWLLMIEIEYRIAYWMIYNWSKE